MLVCPIYERERKEVNGRKVVIIGFRRIPTDKFQDIIDVIKDYGAHYIPEKKTWFAKVKDWEDINEWFKNGHGADKLYVYEDDDYEAVRRGL